MFLTKSGALTLKGGVGMSGGQDPLFTPLPPFFRPPFAAWFSSLDPTLGKNNKFRILWEKFVKNFKNIQLYSLNLAQISVHKPPRCLKISVPETLLSQKISSLAPHFGAPRLTSLPKIKLSAPPGVHPCQFLGTGMEHTHWAIPLEIHIPPVEDLDKVFHRGSADFKRLHLLGSSI